MSEDVIFSRMASVAEQIEKIMRECVESFDAALYRLNNSRLARALTELDQRGVRIRLLVDGGKYKEDAATPRLLETGRVPFRLTHGRIGPSSKMHHKFVILDGVPVLTGSYNWTTESEEQNCENLVILRDPAQVRAFQQEFEELWREAENKA
jgi:phosphatidylserine/phosphatidylglycerophosphate/cardiolipin synthase-like enzyme